MKNDIHEYSVWIVRESVLRKCEVSVSKGSAALLFEVLESIFCHFLGGSSPVVFGGGGHCGGGGGVYATIWYSRLLGGGVEISARLTLL